MHGAKTRQGTGEGEDAPKTVFTHRYEAGISLHTRGMGGLLERGTYRGVGKIEYLVRWVHQYEARQGSQELQSGI